MFVDLSWPWISCYQDHGPYERRENDAASNAGSGAAFGPETCFRFRPFDRGLDYCDAGTFAVAVVVDRPILGDRSYVHPAAGRVSGAGVKKADPSAGRALAGMPGRPRPDRARAGHFVRLPAEA